MQKKKLYILYIFSQSSTRISSCQSKEREPWSQPLGNSEPGLSGSEVALNSRQLQGRGSQPRRRSFGSLSDLTNVDLDRDMGSLDKDRCVRFSFELLPLIQVIVLNRNVFFIFSMMSVISTVCCL